MDNIFEDDDLNIDIDGLQLVDIDIDGIDEASKQAAEEMVNNLSKFYYNEEFMKNNPNFKKRVDTELESLRILIKMRKTDEVVLDVLIKAISGNSNNASLYRSLTEIQKTILSITTKMNDVIVNLNNLMKGYQLEIDFDKDDESETLSETGTQHRGSKSFIEMMNNDDNLFKEEEINEE